MSNLRIPSSQRTLRDLRAIVSHAREKASLPTDKALGLGVHGHSSLESTRLDEVSIRSQGALVRISFYGNDEPSAGAQISIKLGEGEDSIVFSNPLAHKILDSVDRSGLARFFGHSNRFVMQSIAYALDTMPSS